jgi:predicted transcriptional regulator
MASIKISSKVEETLWAQMKELAEESHQSISGLLNDAIRDFLQRKRVRPAVLKHLENSVAENERLGKLLAR